MPIVPAAVIFDRARRRGRRAGPGGGRGGAGGRDGGDGRVVAAAGRVGAGTGADRRRARAARARCQGGFGAAVVELPGGARVAAVAVVNALGDVIGEPTARCSRAARHDGHAILARHDRLAARRIGQATTLVCVITDAELDKLACLRLARAAHAGVARATSPAATAFDGDVAFAVATRAFTAPPPAAARDARPREVTALAIRDAVAPR